MREIAPYNKPFNPIARENARSGLTAALGFHMGIPSNNETWLIDIADAVIHKKADVGVDGLAPLEKLIYCVWIVDYGMRNAGDLETAYDLYPEFHSEASRIARSLSLPLTSQAFSLSTDDLTAQYFDLFEPMCEELKDA